jgi:hypothetical protein
MSATHGKGVACLGYSTGVLDLFDAYPWAIAPVLTLVCQALFAIWFLAVGVRLYHLR